jgi:hypothetical protein
MVNSLSIASGAAPVSAAVFNDESQIESIYLKHLRDTESVSETIMCPNDSDELTYEDFAESADELIDPFSKAVDANYAN